MIVPQRFQLTLIAVGLFSLSCVVVLYFVDRQIVKARSEVADAAQREIEVCEASLESITSARNAMQDTVTRLQEAIRSTKPEPRIIPTPGDLCVDQAPPQALMEQLGWQD